MPSRRGQIRLSDDEVRELIESERIVSVGTQGPRGWPHVMPIWYVPRDGEIWIYTYGKSQKIRNLERDPRATLMIEAGHDYHELRGLMIEAEAEIHGDFETVFQLAQDLNVRYTAGIESVPEEGLSVLEKQVPKRVAVHFRPSRTASWDHRKLGGTY
jgi:PPOX class probable F420-dependent enzyme